MTNPSVLLELAGRVEALTEASREVDFLIADAVLGEIKAPFIRGRCEKYTASIDAAMTLIDSNIPAHVLRDAMSALADRFRLHVTFWPADQSYTEWLARFVAAACLRALAAREG